MDACMYGYKAWVSSGMMRRFFTLSMAGYEMMSMTTASLGVCV